MKFNQQMDLMLRVTKPGSAHTATCKSQKGLTTPSRGMRIAVLRPADIFTTLAGSHFKVGYFDQGRDTLWSRTPQR